MTSQGIEAGVRLDGPAFARWPTTGDGAPDHTPYEPEVAYPDGFPLQFDVQYQHTYSRAHAPAKWVLMAPHVFVLLFTFVGLSVAWVLAAVAVVVTGRYPRPVFDFAAGAARWILRIGAYSHLVTDAYPPFAYYALPSFPVQAEVAYPAGGRIARWRPLVHPFLLLPHYVVLVFLYLGTWLILLMVLTSLVSTGRYPRGLFDLVVRTLRFHARLTVYLFFATERHPGFRV